MNMQLFSKTVDYKPTHKKKNTYVVKISPFHSLKMFALCGDTPMLVTKKNGASAQTGEAWATATRFPNPFAQYMVNEYPQLQPVMGNLSTTIVEYLDKDTGAPVLQLYPTSVYVFDGYENDYMSHLNHASRRDLNHQIEQRRKMLEMLNQKSK